MVNSIECRNTDTGLEEGYVRWCIQVNGLFDWDMRKGTSYSVLLSKYREMVVLL